MNVSKYNLWKIENIFLRTFLGYIILIFIGLPLLIFGFFSFIFRGIIESIKDFMDYTDDIRSDMKKILLAKKLK